MIVCKAVKRAVKSLFIGHVGHGEMDNN